MIHTAPAHRKGGRIPVEFSRLGRGGPHLADEPPELRPEGSTYVTARGGTSTSEGVRSIEAGVLFHVDVLLVRAFSDGRQASRCVAKVYVDLQRIRSILQELNTTK